MDYKFLHKVLDQLVYETRIDYGMEEISSPFSSFSYRSPHHLSLVSLSYLSTRFFHFSNHCKDIYGLNEQEIEYVWKVYSDDIIYKIKEEKYR